MLVMAVMLILSEFDKKVLKSVASISSIEIQWCIRQNFNNGLTQNDASEDRLM